MNHQRIIDCLKNHYGIEVVKLTRLPLGADMNASVYKAETQSELAYFVKLKRNHHYDISIAIIELLHNAQIQAIIPPIHTLYGKSIQSIDHCSLIVYPFIEGQDGFSRPLTDEQWINLGKTLRHIHDINVPSSMIQHIRRETFSPQWREAVRSIYHRIETGPAGDEIAINLLAFIEEHKKTIQRLVDKAEELAAILCKESLKLVLCHSDIHGGNILMDNHNNLYIVDWDEPIMAPKERDLMFIGGGVGNVWNDPHEEVLFYQGYGATDVDKRILHYYRYERIVEDIAIYNQGILFPAATEEDKIQMFKHFTSMFEPRGVVDIALGTA